jgi:hypothetical protein
MHRNFYTEEMCEVDMFNKAYKVVESVDKLKQYDCALRYINLFYYRTENFVLYNTLLRNLQNKKPLLN